MDVKSQESPTDDAAAADLQLIRQARAGDWSAFEALVDRFQMRVFGLARRIVRHQQDAEDVVQQTFLAVLEHLDRFREHSSVATWILRIATNHALKILRKRRGLATTSLEANRAAEDDYASLPHPDYIAQWRDGPEELAERAEVRQLLDEALAGLEEKYRLVFVLRDMQGYNTAETADLLDITTSNVKVRLLRARLQLRELMTRKFGDEATRVFPDHHHH